MFDVIISGGVVADGTGAPTFRADVGIDGDRILEIGDLSESGARRVINAPDSPSRPDSSIPTPTLTAYCSSTPSTPTACARASPPRYSARTAQLRPVVRQQLPRISTLPVRILGEPPEDLDMSSVAAFRSHYHRKVAINTAYNVPHAALRLETVGFRDVPLRGDAMSSARDMVRRGMEEGAVGFATGMSYHPNAWSDTDELV